MEPGRREGLRQTIETFPTDALERRRVGLDQRIQEKRDLIAELTRQLEDDIDERAIVAAYLCNRGQYED